MPDSKTPEFTIERVHPMDLSFSDLREAALQAYESGQPTDDIQAYKVHGVGSLIEALCGFAFEQGSTMRVGITHGADVTWFASTGDVEADVAAFLSGDLEVLI